MECGVSSPRELVRSVSVTSIEFIVHLPVQRELVRFVSVTSIRLPVQLSSLFAFLSNVSWSVLFSLTSIEYPVDLCCHVVLFVS